MDFSNHGEVASDDVTAANASAQAAAAPPAKVAKGVTSKTVDPRAHGVVTDESRDALLRPVSAGLSELPELRLDAVQATAVRHGNPVLLTGARAPVTLDEAWASHAGQAIATGSVEFGQFRPRRVFN